MIIKKWFKLILVLGFLSLLPKPVQALDCFSNFNGSQTVNVETSCTLATFTDANNESRLISGIDAGSGDSNTAILTIESGSMTINSNETLVVGSLQLTGGSIALAADGGQIKVGDIIWLIDADNDGYPATTSIYLQASAPTDGKRLNTLTDSTTADCDDNDANYNTACCAAETLYADLDGDGYGAGTGTSMCPTAGYVANNSDCYDADPATTNAELAYPGSTTCSTTSRGDGSFDYNCDDSQAKCGTNYGYSASGVSFNYEEQLGSCNNSNSRCSLKSNVIYAAATINCGQTGGVCTATAGKKGGNCNCISEGCSNGSDECYMASNPVTGLCSAVSTGVQNCQ
jgi:hypothetical protein